MVTWFNIYIPIIVKYGTKEIYLLTLWAKCKSDNATHLQDSFSNLYESCYQSEVGKILHEEYVRGIKANQK